MRKSKKTAPKPKTRKRRRTRSKKSKVTRRLTPYQRMVADPCEGPLTRAFSGAAGSSLIERTRQSITLSGTETESVNGYMLWFPGYAGASSVEPAFSGANFYYFVNSNVLQKPGNTTASPLGREAANTTGIFLKDPAYDNLKEDSIFSTGRTLAACLTMDYIGQLNECKGQFAVVQNLNVSTLVNSVADLDFPSVEEIFNYGITRGRLPLEGHQVIWRPNEADCKARMVGAPTQTVPVTDALFRAGSTAGSKATLNDPDPSEARGVLIAWKGVPPNSLVFNAVKIAEYTLSLRSKGTEMPVTTSRSSLSIDSAVSALDSMFPGWQQSALRGAGAAAHAAMSAYVMPTSATYLSRAAPMMLADGEL